MHQHHGTSGAASGHNRTRLIVAVCITATILVAEVVGAVITGSLALLVDAAHMLTDLIGLLMALTAASLAMRPPSNTRTWGLRRAEILGALAQASLLFGVGIFALVEGVRRFFEPPEVVSGPLLFFGILGLIANIIAMMVLAGGRGSSLNMRAAFLEVLNDALGSVGVIVSAVAIMWFGYHRADAIVGIAIALLIIPRTIIIARASLRVLLESTPPGLDLAKVRTHLLGVPHVLQVHDLHASLIDTNTPVLSAHVQVADECFNDGHAAEVLNQLGECASEHFDIPIEHTTFQIEPVSHQERHELHP